MTCSYCELMGSALEGPCPECGGKGYAAATNAVACACHDCGETVAPGAGVECDDGSRPADGGKFAFRHADRKACRRPSKPLTAANAAYLAALANRND